MTNSDQARPRFATGVRLQWDDVRAQHMLVFPEGLLTLNASAAEVLELCDGERTTAEIVAALEERYPGADLTGDVDELLGAIAQKGLVVDVG